MQSQIEAFTDHTPQIELQRMAAYIWVCAFTITNQIYRYYILLLVCQHKLEAVILPKLSFRGEHDDVVKRHH